MICWSFFMLAPPRGSCSNLRLATSYGRGGGVDRGLGSGVFLGVGVGRGVGVGVAVAVAVGVGLAQPPPATLISTVFVM